MKEIRLIGTTNGSGAATITAETPRLGMLYAVELVDGDLADGVDLTLKVIRTVSGVDLTLYNGTDFNSDAMKYPRHLVHDESGTALTGTAGGDRTMPVVAGTLQVTLAQGGDTKTGGCIVYLCD